MNNIHPTAIVSKKAMLGEDITIGPGAIIHDDVEIGDGSTIGPYAVLYDGARIGKRVRIHQSASIANIPQDLKFNGEPTKFFVGDDTTIHEFVTLHRGTHETGFSRVGSNCLLMAYSHVAHDTVVGNNCILSNGVQLAGHVELEDWVIIGGLTPVHQFCRVGQHSMIGGGFRIVQDVPPFVLAGNEPLRFSGLNVIGLRRRGFSNDQIAGLKQVYGIIYSSGLTLSLAKAKLRQEYCNDPLAMTVVEFFDKCGNRGFIRR
ncbi:MAG: acyl-ACP--UDP-N-acetylglucosamine O-acyltransferase [Ignavibacteria bacterium]|jgi:UDP-N-acetylglucosamine acyltransferase|nr:acyl-ACP--UDP-N-acetylglucosamine O-acyltransferase [Ignavibacteria bacterium]MCU7504123.1 acyl-ACP--UDP-N-acetylglucosamine O-acyltransferase [Ignavibacteria bacterium]MCU7516427.1 acyl-ACP--UDP-N-acetylglucosamine O-acyltransferase [Ignavibacteria bacterium]